MSCVDIILCRAVRVFQWFACQERLPSIGLGIDHSVLSQDYISILSAVVVFQSFASAVHSCDLWHTAVRLDASAL
jgi:hypothetical protein